jgi:hypothetical protein
LEANCIRAKADLLAEGVSQQEVEEMIKEFRKLNEESNAAALQEMQRFMQSVGTAQPAHTEQEKIESVDG